MKKVGLYIFFTIVFVLMGEGLTFAACNSKSIYTLRPEDSEAYYFDVESYGLKADGKCDVTQALQSAINKVKKEKNFGIIFFPEGKYRLTSPIYIPGSIRLIGYGKKRPELILAPSTKGYQEDINYMVWFTSAIVEKEGNIADAHAGTFYSGISNINFRIGKGNPTAAAIRSRFAQHCFVSYCDMYIGEGLAGIHHVGNEIENVNFYGGQYGILTSRTSPGWPMMMVDTYFEGQKYAAIKSREAGFAIVNMHVRNVPVVFEMEENVLDRLYIESSLFENVSDCGIKVSVEGNTFSQLNLKDVQCSNVPVLIHYLKSGKKIEVRDKYYDVKNYIYGLAYENLEQNSEFKEISDIVKLSTAPVCHNKVIPSLPAMSEWVSVKSFGAVGDGITDDTESFLRAISSHKTIYVPQGWYRISKTLKFREGTCLIGLHPYGTQLIIKDGETEFSGFGTPSPVVESSKGGSDILNGIGINTGSYNFRAVGCKWMGGCESYLNDVKFIGGHGTLEKPNSGDKEQMASVLRGDQVLTTKVSAWDNQHWSLWITNGGGGTFKDIWTANPYAASGLRISDTSTSGRVYAMSLEHHVRTETTMSNVSNWKFYAFQFEEEEKEGVDCIMGELSGCSNLEFVNVWMYRSVRASLPKKVGINIWDCKDIIFRNLHNYTQALPVIQFPVYDMYMNRAASSWDFAYLHITGKEKGRREKPTELYRPVKLADGFELATGATSDSQGNVYFCETRLKKIYKWSSENGKVTMVGDYPWSPLAISTDTKDNVLVLFRYYPQPGFLINGEQEQVYTLPDENPWYSGWGNGGWVVWGYSFNPECPDETIHPMPRIKTKDADSYVRIIHPSSRWRWKADFVNGVTTLVNNSFIAPDNITIIPETGDLGRVSSLTAIEKGQNDFVYLVDEVDKKTIKFSVDSEGKLKEEGYLCPFGQYSNVTDNSGNVYIADGKIYVYDEKGKNTVSISMSERPVSLAIGGKNREILLVTTGKSLYGVRIK